MFNVLVSNKFDCQLGQCCVQSLILESDYNQGRIQDFVQGGSRILHAHGMGCAKHQLEIYRNSENGPSWFPQYMAFPGAQVTFIASERVQGCHGLVYLHHLGLAPCFV